MQIVPLWETNIPLFEQEAGQKPYMEVYLSSKAKQAAPFVIICPGGAYEALSADHEGRDVARMFNENGIHAAVLFYRISPYHYPVMQLDGARAVRVVRFHASAWGVDPDKIGIMGFSAGGHFAALALTHYMERREEEAGDEIDECSARPDFGVLCYAVISMHDGVTHDRTREVLFGNGYGTALTAALSCEDCIPSDCPPVFLWHSEDDACVSVQNTLGMAKALCEKHIPCEVHIFPHSPHGIGMGDGKDPDQLHCGQWVSLCCNWLCSYLL